MASVEEYKDIDRGHFSERALIDKRPHSDKTQKTEFEIHCIRETQLRVCCSVLSITISDNYLIFVSNVGKKSSLAWDILNV